MDKYRREVTIEILVGLFMFTVLIALSIFTIVLSHEHFMQKTYTYDIAFPEVGGLRDGDNVFLRGVRIGRVKETVMRPEKVLVHISVQTRLQFHKGYRIEIVDSSMLGGKFLKLDEGPETAPTLPKDAQLVGLPPVDLTADLSDTVDELKRAFAGLSEGKGTIGKLLVDDSLYNNLEATSANLRKITTRIEEGKGTIGKLLSDNGQVYDDAKASLANVRTITQDIADGKGTLGKLVTADDSTYADLQATIANLREITGKINSGEGTLGNLVSTNDTFYTDLQSTMAHLQSITAQIDSGKGTIGKLVKDEQLYDQLVLLIEDVRAGIDDLREAAPITSFGSILFGAF